MKKSLYFVAFFLAFIFSAWGEDQVPAIYQFDPVITQVSVAVIDNGQVIERVQVLPRRSFNLLTGGKKFSISFMNASSEEVVRLDLELNADEKFSGRVAVNNSNGLVGCAITDQVVVCSTSSSPASLNRIPLFVFWPGQGRMLEWRLPPATLKASTVSE